MESQENTRSDHAEGLEKDSEKVQPFEKPLPQITKMTTRQMVTKLELPTSDAYHVSRPVAEKVFDFDISGKPMADRKTNNKWHLTDEVYDNALNGYKEVVAAFERHPRVYKFDSTKEKMFQYREAYLPETIRAKENARIAELKAKEGSKNKGVRSKLNSLKRSNSKNMTRFLEDEEEAGVEIDVNSLSEEQKAQRYEEELGTVIDPFSAPFPWARKTRPSGEVVFVNEETKEVKTKQPGEVWEDKFSKLEHLTPREDFSAWDYRESEKERRKRFKIQGDFERKMMKEIERREQHPNDLEQVEDALYDIVDTIAKRDAKSKWVVSVMRKREERSVWHPNTFGFRLEPLEPIKNMAADSDDEGIPRVTDLEFNENVIISATGHVLAKLRPWNLFDIHEKEREIQREMERKRLEAELAERNKPMSQKISDFVGIAKEDPSAAARHVARGIRNRASEIPDKIPTSAEVLAKSKGALVKGKDAIVTAFNNPEEAYTHFRRNVSSAYFKIFPPSEEAVMLRTMMKDMEEKESAKDLLEAQEKEAEEARRIEARNRRRAAVRLGNLDMSPKPVDIPDATLVTLTLLVDPPPPYELVPPPTWYDPATALALHFQRELLGIEAKQKGFRKPPKFVNARSSLELYKNWENEFLKRHLARAEDYEYNSLASSVKLKKRSDSSDESDESDDDSSDESDDGSSDEEKEDAEEEDVISAVERKDSSSRRSSKRSRSSRKNSELSAHEEKEDDSRGSDDGDHNSEHVSRRDDNEEVKNEDNEDNIDGDNNEDSREVKNDEDEEDRKDVDSDMGNDENDHNSDSDDDGDDDDNSDNEDKTGHKADKEQGKPQLPQYQLKAIAKQLWANYKDRLAGAAVFIKDEFDDKHRKRFEQTLLDEISTCACIPAKFFSIEEVRKLPPNHDLLKSKLRQKEEYFAEQARQEEEKRAAEEAVKEENLELVARIHEMSQHKQAAEQKLREEQSTERRRSLASLFSLRSHPTQRQANEDEESTSLERNSAGRTNLSPEEESYLSSIETEELRRKTLKASARKKSVWEQKIDVIPKLDPMDENVALKPTSGQDGHLSPTIHHGVPTSKPISPRQLIAAINNPMNDRYDPNHWMAKLMREETYEEKQLRRIAMLKTLQMKGSTRAQVIQAKIRALQQKKQELSELAECYLGPSLNLVKRAVGPISEHIQRKSTQCAREIHRRRLASSAADSEAEDESAIVLRKRVESEEAQQAKNIVLNANAAAAVAQENAMSDEESRNRATIARLQDRLEQEEEELQRDLQEVSGEECESVEVDHRVTTDELQSAVDEDVPCQEEVDVDDNEDTAEVRKVLDMMCHTIKKREDDRYDIYDEYLDFWYQQEHSTESELIGCQVSLMVHVDDSLRQNLYLHELKSEDIAVMLRNQLQEKDSSLYAQSITRHVVGVDFKSVTNPRNYKEWEHMWVHVLSPTYFRYCTRPVKRDRFVQEREVGRLRSGVMLVNPIFGYNDNQKAIFNGLVQPKSKFEIDDAGVKATFKFDVDDIGSELFGDDGKPKLHIYRPNLKEITKREVEKCKRIYRAFLDKYNQEMTFGLARGGLRANQYSALKDMETAKRIYDIAKQKFARDERLEGEGPAIVPHITKISGEQFEEWMQEAKEEEAEVLREKKAKKLQMQELRKQEAEMRRRYAQQKHWMTSKLMEKMPNSGQELSTLVREELDAEEAQQGKLNDPQTTDREREEINRKKADLKKLIISEEKNTRVLFKNIRLWCQSESTIGRVLTKESLKQESGESKSERRDDDIVSNISEDTDMGFSAANSQQSSLRGRRSKIQSDSGDSEPLPVEKVLAYLTNAQKRFIADQKYFTKLAEEERLMAMAAKRQRRMMQMDEARKAMLEFSMDVSRKKKAEKAMQEEEVQVTAAKSASSDSSDSSTTSQSSSSVSISMLKKNRFALMDKEVARFSDQEMSVFPHLSWFKLCIHHSEYFECLRQLPVMKTGCMTRDELVQFARICCELSPSMLKAKDRLKKLREETLNTKALKEKRFRDRQESRLEANKKPLDTEEEADFKAKTEYRRLVAEGLAKEAQKRKLRLKAAQKRRKKREKAWLYAHQHMFIKVAGEPPYCCVCRDKMDQARLEGLEKAEKKWNEEFEATLAERVDQFQPEAKRLVEEDHKSEVKAKQSQASSNKVTSPLMDLPIAETVESSSEKSDSGDDGEEGIKKASDQNKDDINIDKDDSSLSPKKEPPTALSPKGLFRGLSSKFSKSFSSMSDSRRDLNKSPVESQEVDETSTKSEDQDSPAPDTTQPVHESDAVKPPGVLSSPVEKRKKSLGNRRTNRRAGIIKAPIPLPDYMIAAGLPAIDPNGVKHVSAPTILTAAEEKEEEAIKAKPFLSKKKSSLIHDDAEGSVDPERLTVFDKYPHEILLKVWNYEYEEKGDFLGYVLIPNEFIANPTKGIRRFPLKTDPSLVKPGAQHLVLHGDLFCKLVPTRKTDVRIHKPSKNKNRNHNETDHNMKEENDSIASGSQCVEAAEEPPPPPRGLLSRFMSAKHVHTTENIALSQEEEQLKKAEKERKRKQEADEAAEFAGPCMWRFQILKGVKLTSVSKHEKSSPIVEVCWKGYCTKKNDSVYESDFQTVGYTSVKKNTVDPDWKGDSSAIFEFPPVWTTADLPGRGESLKDPLKGGGYVPKNNIPENAPEKTRKFRGSVLLKMKADDVSAMQTGLLASMHKANEQSSKTSVLFKDLAVDSVKDKASSEQEIENLTDKMAFKSRVFKALAEAEEVERKCMAREEKRIYIHHREAATAFEAPYLEEQKRHEKVFSKLIQHLQSPPPILGRVRFLMSSLMKGGGTCTMCQDPSTHRNVDVYSVPIMYDEDEDELVRQVNVMLGRHHTSIMEILNFSVHQVLGFSMTGHATLNERIAMVVCHNEQCVSLLEYVKFHYSMFTDKEMRHALMQITNALMSLHRDGLIHRNIHPEAVKVRITKEKTKPIGVVDDEDGNANSSEDDDDSEDELAIGSVSTMSSLKADASSLRNRPVYVLEDFWFLHNPRRPGCEYSMGRADWGNASTLPPEALGGHVISDKSDVWGLGVSTFMWATRGLTLNVQDGSKFDFEDIAKKLPLKWGPWLLSFLRMCLERDPKYRASSSELYEFLIGARPID